MAQSSKKLLSAYLVNGPDELKRDVVLKRLRSRIAEEGDISFNSDDFSGESATGEAIVSACNTLPFASPVRLVSVVATEKLKKADQEAIVSYLDSPCDSTVLCLSSTGLAKNTRLFKAIAAIDEKAVIDCSNIKKQNLPAAVCAMATGYGASMTQSAAHMLIELVGENSIALNGQVQKLALAHRGNDPITDNEVSSMVSRTAEVKPWEFVDAFSARNAKKCLLLLSRMESVSPHALLAMCVNRLRELIAARCLAQRGKSAELAKRLKVPDWRVKNHTMWAQRFTDEELRRALVSARDAERSMKSGADPQAAFEMWFLAAIVSQPHR